MITQTPHQTNSNNIKTEKYFSDIIDNSIKKALEIYQKKLKSNYKEQKKKKILNSINSIQSYSKLRDLKKVQV